MIIYESTECGSWCTEAARNVVVTVFNYEGIEEAMGEFKRILNKLLD